MAQTIGTEIIRPEAINLVTLGAALVGIIIWSTAASFFGIPTSESHALLAGLAGAGLATPTGGVITRRVEEDPGLVISCSSALVVVLPSVGFEDAGRGALE